MDGEAWRIALAAAGEPWWATAWRASVGSTQDEARALRADASSDGQALQGRNRGVELHATAQIHGDRPPTTEPDDTGSEVAPRPQRLGAVNGDRRFAAVGAALQRAGRGRGGAAWQAEAGAAALVSVAGPIAVPAELWPRLSLGAGLAVRSVVAGWTAARVALKWPNDLVVAHGDGWAKVGGLLCERHAQPQDPALWVAGVGVNLTAAPVHTDGLPAVAIALLPGCTAPPPGRAAALLAIALRDAARAFERCAGAIDVAALDRHLAWAGDDVWLDLGPTEAPRWLRLDGIGATGGLRGRWIGADGRPAGPAVESVPLAIRARRAPK